MFKRDWQKDMALCRHEEIRQLPKLAWREVEKLGVGSYRVKAIILTQVYLDKALEGWHAALQERARLEEENRRLRLVLEANSITYQGKERNGRNYNHR